MTPESPTPVMRAHLVEIAETAWCPSVIRDGVTDYLQHVIATTQPYAPATELLRNALATTSHAGTSHASARETARGGTHTAPRIIDLGSGGGGPWRTLASALGPSVDVLLTDAYPNVAAFATLEQVTQGRVRGDATPRRADAIPPEWGGLRTMFSAFHHLRPADAIALLRSTTEAGHPIAIFEATRRSVPAMLLTLITPLLVLAMTPAIRPIRWSRLLFTYLIPLIPLTVLFDGLVSCWRTYTPDELLALARLAAPSGVRWQSGVIGSGPIPVTYLIGTIDAPT